LRANVRDHRSDGTPSTAGIGSGRLSGFLTIQKVEAHHVQPTAAQLVADGQDALVRNVSAGAVGAEQETAPLDGVDAGEKTAAIVSSAPTLIRHSAFDAFIAIEGSCSRVQQHTTLKLQNCCFPISRPRWSMYHS